MDLKTSNGQKLFTDFAEKLTIAKEICAIYATGKYTIESVCASKSLPVRTFTQWKKEIPEIAALYKESKNKKKEERRGELLELAETALQRRLQGWVSEETIVEGTPDANGEIKRKRMRKTRKNVPPDSTLIIFALKIGNPKKYTPQDVNPEDEDQETHYDYTKLTPSELEEFERIVDKLGKPSD